MVWVFPGVTGMGTASVADGAILITPLKMVRLLGQ